MINTINNQLVFVKNVSKAKEDVKVVS